MRPIELTLDGFRSYAEQATFRWEGRRLVAVVGPIGSGKSSILDGIAFALYGRTPRIGRNVRSLVNQRRDQATAALTFAVDGSVLKAVRTVRRSGQSAHALYRVEGGVETPIADRAAAVTELVAEVLGLDFDGFTRSVMLAQGQFAAFLEAGPADRNDVLKGVFGLERLDAMREAAVRHRTEAAAELTALEAARTAMAADRAALEDARGALAQAEERAAALVELTPSVAALEERTSAAREARTTALREVERLTALAADVPERAATDALLQSARQGADRIEAAAAALTTAEQRLSEAQRALEATTQEAGDRDSLAEAATLVEVLGQQRRHAEQAAQAASAADSRVGAAGQAVAAARTELEACGRALDAAQEALTGMSAARAEAERALHEARHNSLALTLRAHLVEGEACPVCEQKVAALPAVRTPPGVAEAEEALEAARLAEAGGEDARSRAAADCSAAAARVEAAEVELERARTGAAEAVAGAAEAGGLAERTREALEAKLGAGDPAKALGAWRAALTGADAAVEKARRDVEAARAEVVTAREENAEVRRSVEGLAGLVNRLAGRLEIDVEVSADPDRLDEALRAVRDAWVAAMAEARRQVEDAEADLAGIAAESAALLEGAGLPKDADPRGAAGEAVAALDAARQRIADIEARLAGLEEMEASKDATISRRDRYALLADDLRRSAFPDFVLADRRRMLADLGSDLFETLSGGRYRFSDDGEFDVVDLAAAEQVRSADSLSGGETFLASLALALALAEIVAREGGRLDAFFLDEGFGSLDPEHLDLAMEGIERLAAMADRLVVVVSHVAALRDRIEDLVVLDKDPLTGATRVLEGAATSR